MKKKKIKFYIPSRIIDSIQIHYSNNSDHIKSGNFYLFFHHLVLCWFCFIALLKVQQRKRNHFCYEMIADFNQHCTRKREMEIKSRVYSMSFETIPWHFCFYYKTQKIRSHDNLNNECATPNVPILSQILLLRIFKKRLFYSCNARKPKNQDDTKYLFKKSLDKNF